MVLLRPSELGCLKIYPRIFVTAPYALTHMYPVIENLAKVYSIHLVFLRQVKNHA